MLGHMSERVPRRFSLLGRLLLGLGVATTILVVANSVIEHLEDEGVVQTHDPDGYVQLHPEPFFVLDGDRWVTSRYAEDASVRSSMRAERSM